MDVTRAEQGRLDIERRVVIVRDLLRDGSQGVASQAYQRGVAVDVHPVDGSVCVTGDRDRLLQALDNLLSNAVKFTPAGGVVVEDTGQGLTVEQQANLFTRFWQARRGDRRGVGLGLTIVKGIVDAHGGTSAVESEPGRGSTFRMCIPKSVSEGDAVETQA
jgi:signal transduction histidine kinase